MLVLTRKLQEQILIGDNIKITILRVKGQNVRIGIEAPREIRVVRGELPPEKVTIDRGDQSQSSEPAIAASGRVAAVHAESDEPVEAPVAERRAPLADFVSAITSQAI